jgi:hypothetical protein
VTDLERVRRIREFATSASSALEGNPDTEDVTIAWASAREIFDIAWLWELDLIAAERRA